MNDYDLLNLPDEELREMLDDIYAMEKKDIHDHLLQDRLEELLEIDN